MDTIGHLVFLENSLSKEQKMLKFLLWVSLLIPLDFLAFSQVLQYVREITRGLCSADIKLNVPLLVKKDGLPTRVAQNSKTTHSLPMTQKLMTHPLCAPAHSTPPSPPPPPPPQYLLSNSLMHLSSEQ